MYNKKLYKEILDYHKADMNLVLGEIKSLLSKNHNKLTPEISDFLSAKSKRLRPLVLFLIKDVLNVETNADIIKLAAALELLHSATLIHDDIIDDATLRRQTETFNIKYNPKIATLAGDYVLSLSLNLLSQINEPKIFEYFSSDTLNICTGEINQFFNKNKMVTIEEYLEKSKNKTSSLFLAGVKSLLWLVDTKIKPLGTKTKSAILDFTLNFSLGFQIYDDIENFKGVNPEKSSSDLENGIYTLPYIYLSQEKNSCDIINYNKALELSIEYLNDTLNKAQESLKALDTNCNKNLLLKLAEAFKGSKAEG